MTAPARIPSRVSPAAVSVGAAVPAAVSHRSLPVTLDARRLLALGCACRRTVGALCLLMRRMERECARGELVDTGEMADIAWMTGRVEESGDLLQELAQDTDLLALLPHRARFADLVRMAQAMDRGLVFVPVEPVEAARLPAPAAVVVVGQDDAPAPGLKARVGTALARLKRRAA